MKPWELSGLDNEKIARLHALYTIEQEIEQYWNSEQARMMDKKASD